MRDINGPVEELPRVHVHSPALRLSAHRRGVQQPLRLLRDPLPAGQLPQPPDGGHSARRPRPWRTSGVQECIVIAQDITRYGMDLYGERKLPELLRELCKLPFHWIRLHYLYPDNLSDELD